MQEPFVSEIGYLAERPDAQQILMGAYQCPPGTPAHVHNMLRYFQRPNGISDQPDTVTPEEYAQTWKMVKEKRSSSHSGRHFGIYKAICRHTELLPTFTTLFNLPFQSGIPYSRWNNLVDVMAYKTRNYVP